MLLSNSIYYFVTVSRINNNSYAPSGVQTRTQAHKNQRLSVAIYFSTFDVIRLSDVFVIHLFLFYFFRSATDLRRSWLPPQISSKQTPNFYASKMCVYFLQPPSFRSCYPSHSHHRSKKNSHHLPISIRCFTCSDQPIL